MQLGVFYLGLNCTEIAILDTRLGLNITLCVYTFVPNNSIHGIRVSYITLQLWIVPFTDVHVFTKPMNTTITNILRKPFTNINPYPANTFLNVLNFCMSMMFVVNTIKPV